MSLREKFAQLLEASQTSTAYWRDIAIEDFTRDLHVRVQRKGISHADLASRMGTSRPYVTRLLSGGNFTLETMVKLAMALDGVIRVHIADREAVTTHWKDEYIGRLDDAMANVDLESMRGLTSGEMPLRTRFTSPTGAGHTSQQPVSGTLTTSGPWAGGRLRPQELYKDTGSGEALSV